LQEIGNIQSLEDSYSSYKSDLKIQKENPEWAVALVIVILCVECVLTPPAELKLAHGALHEFATATALYET